MAKFAEGTRVMVKSSRDEIEKLVTRFGASRFMVAIDGDSNTAAIQFFAKARMIRLTLSLHDKGKKVSEVEERRRWRSLALLLKAKLVAVEDGLVEFEEEFLPHVVLHDGQTVYQRTRSDLALEYSGKGEPKLYLLGGPS